MDLGETCLGSLTKGSRKILKKSSNIVKHKLRLTKLGKTQKTHKKSEGFASLLKTKQKKLLHKNQCCENWQRPAKPCQFHFEKPVKT